jgi:soluble lytic murein transglycosylase-like protein
LVLSFLSSLNPASFAFDVPALDNGIFLRTFWQEGFGRQIAYQNKYNLPIIRAVNHWRKMDPLILKSLLIQESNFCVSSINRNGYAGIAQLGPREARLLGLKTSKGVDQRLIPDTAIAACVDLIKIKASRLENGIFTR